jgi:hypothetical protein
MGNWAASGDSKFPLMVHGAYVDEHELAERLESLDPHVLLFPGQAQETYSFTLSEVMRYAVPKNKIILTPSPGVLEERLATYEMARSYDVHSSPEEIADMLIRVAS